MNNKFLLVGASLMTLAQIAFTHTDFMNTIFKSQSLDFQTWIQIIIISFMVIFIVDIKLYISNKLTGKEPNG